MSSGAIAQILIAFIIGLSSIGTGIWMFREGKKTRNRKLQIRSYFILIIGIAINIGLFIPGFIRLYTENLWFGELGYDSVFWKILKVKWLTLFARFALIALIFLGINYFFIDRICPISSEFKRWTRRKTGFARKICIIIIIILAVMLSAPMMLFWENFIKYENRVPVGKNQIGILTSEEKKVQAITPNLDKRIANLVFGPNDNLYVIEDRAISTVDIDTGVLTPLIKDIDNPRDITFDIEGNMYVAAESRIYKIPKSDISSNQINDLDKKIFIDDLSHPSAIALDKRGYLYIADFKKNEIIKISDLNNDGDIEDTNEKEVIIEHSKSNRRKRAKSIIEEKLIIGNELREKLGMLYSDKIIDLLNEKEYEEVINEFNNIGISLSTNEEQLLPYIASIIENNQKRLPLLLFDEKKAQKSIINKLNQGRYKEAIDFLSMYLVSISKIEEKILRSASEQLSGTVDLLYSEKDDLFYVAEWQSGEISEVDMFNRTINRIAKGLSNPRNIVIDSQNNLYIAEASSGEISLVELESISTDFEEEQSLLSVERVVRGLSSPTSLAIDSSDSLYLAESLDRDPIFNKEIGFFMFQLPIYNIITIWVKTLLWVTIIFCIFVYNFYYNRDPQSMERVSNLGVKHISLLVLMTFIISIVRSRLNIYNLMNSPLMARHYGIGYTDIVTRIPGYKIFIAIVIGLGIVVIVNMFKRKRILWYITGSIWVVSYLILIWLIPFLFYELRVDPNELILEPQYIRRHVDSTRKGFGLDMIEEQETQLSQATMNTIRENEEVLRNIQLWDRRAFYEAAMQLQIIRHYYAFHRFTDVDRYRITMENGTRQYRELVLAAREITTKLIEPPSWINKHLNYTHGYGLCVAPVNEFTNDGRPVFWVGNIPTVSRFPTSSGILTGAPIKELNVTQPRIYYGEMTDTYVIARTEPEFDYTEGQTEYQYEGHGGIEMEGLFRRLAFSWRFKRLKIMLSQTIRSDSRMMFRREVLKRAKACAPFLEFDEDPFIVIGDSGKLWWVIDTYVKDKDYPYSQPFPIVEKEELKRYSPRDPGIQDFRGSNYIRNPAVAIIDAYHGDLNIYILNGNEPLIRIYDKAFPGIFKYQEEIPDGLEKHIRYPDTFVYLKAQMYAKYHQDDPRTFYRSEDLWKLPKEKYKLDYIYMTPYFAVFPLPGKEPRPEFVSMFPFIPPGTNRKMAAWLVGRSDVPNYGETLVYKLPPNEKPDSPEQVEGRIEKLPTYAAEMEILGNKILRGNLLVIPIGNDIVYVEPIYYQESQTKSAPSEMSQETRPMPEIRYVIVAASDKLAMAKTMDEALEIVFVGERVETASSTAEEKDSTGRIWSDWTQVLKGNKINTTDGETPITLQTTFAGIAGANVANNDTVILTGTDHSGKTVWGKIPIYPNKTVKEFLVDIEKEFNDKIMATLDERGRVLFIDKIEGESKLSISLSPNNEGGGDLSFGQIQTINEGKEKPRTVSQLIASANTNFEQYKSLMGKGNVEEAAKALTALKKDLEHLANINEQLESSLNSLSAKLENLKNDPDVTDKQIAILETLRSEMEKIMNLVKQTSSKIISKL